AYLGREAAGAAVSFPRRASGCVGELDLGLFHFSHECFYAASGGSSSTGRWLSRDRQPQRLSAKSVGLGAVCSQSIGGARDWLVRGCSRRRLLYLARTPPDPG